MTNFLAAGHASDCAGAFYAARKTFLADGSRSCRRMRATFGRKRFGYGLRCRGMHLLKKFSTELDAQLSGKVAGYVSMIGPLPVVTTYGVARTSADPPALAEDTTSRINVASVSKILTTIGALQSIARHNLTLDTAILPYLPPDWTKGAGVGAVTFRELLTHSAGFQAPVNVDNAGLQQLIATDIDPTYKASCQGLGHGCYNNLNFAIFRVLLAYMEGFSDPGPALRSSVIDAFYIQYMRQNVFMPLGISTDCKPVPGSNPKLSYHFPLVAGEHGNDWGDNTSICGRTGRSLSPMNSIASGWRCLAAQHCSATRRK